MTISSAESWSQKQKERQKNLRQFGKAKRSYKWLYFSVLAVCLVAFTAAGGNYFYQRYAAEAAIEVAGNIITVRRGGDFQAALNRARPGDTIMLEAGASFKGTYTLPNKPGTEFITIRSTASDVQLPPVETRIDPKQYAAVLPKLLAASSEPVISTASGAHHYRFIGVEISSGTPDYVYNLVLLGNEEKRIEDLPHHIEFDRCYLHPGDKGKTRRGIALNGGDTIVKNSYLAGFAYSQEETQAIAGWKGTGPFKIINNYLEAGAENILFGGSDPSIKDLVPSDIEIRNNYMTKPLEWRGKVSVKCTLELKNARRVIISGNVIENTFDDMAVRLTVRNQDGSAPWSTIEDVVMENNVVRNSGGGVNFLGTDDNNKSAMMKRVKVANNLFLDINGKKWGGDGRFITIADGEDITVSNNTVFHSGNIITAHGRGTKNFVFQNNILSYNNYGYNGEDAGVGVSVLNKFFAGGIFRGNVVINSENLTASEIFVPVRNFVAPNFQSIGFTDLQKNDFRLAANSKYKGRGADGKDPGVDFAIFEKQFINKPL